MSGAVGSSDWTREFLGVKTWKAADDKIIISPITHNETLSGFGPADTERDALDEKSDAHVKNIVFLDVAGSDRAQGSSGMGKLPVNLRDGRYFQLARHITSLQYHFVDKQREVVPVSYKILIKL